MLEMLLCSLVTLLPDYLYRRYVQGKRLGKEITFYSVWFELRWGITGCLILTVALITTVFYNHPSTTNVTLFFRTVPVLPEINGRVAEIFVSGTSSPITAGAPIFRLDDSKQQAAVETARRKIAEAEADRKQTQKELDTQLELQRRNPENVAPRQIEKLQIRLEGDLATKASAEAALVQAETDLGKTMIRAGVSGRVEQFALRVGDIVNPLMRPAGILIPEGAGYRQLQAGFGQIEAQIMKVGMVAEVTCVSVPFTIIPAVVTGVQDYIAAGQFRGGEQLVDVQQVAKPGTLLVFLEPLYKNGLDGVTPGSSCIANAYSNNHDVIVAKDTGFFKALALHTVDALALVHALILRLQALVLPFQTLVFSGH